MKRSSTSARITQDAITRVVSRYDGATLEDVRGYVRMKRPHVTDRTILRHIAALVQAGIIKREGSTNHFLYSLAKPREMHP